MTFDQYSSAVMWLDANWRTYSGSWVAFYGFQMVYCGSSAAAVCFAVRHLGSRAMVVEVKDYAKA